MTEAILVALISGSLSLFGVVISNFATSKKTEAKIQTSQAVTETKLEEPVKLLLSLYEKLRTAHAKEGKRYEFLLLLQILT